MNTKAMEKFEVMDEMVLSTIEGGRSFFYDLGYWYGNHASLDNLINNLGLIIRS